MLKGGSIMLLSEMKCFTINVGDIFNRTVRMNTEMPTVPYAYMR